MKKTLDWPLMSNNITDTDCRDLAGFLATGKYPPMGHFMKRDPPRLTNGPMVERFEHEFSRWLGTKYAVMVNSGASANMLSMRVIADMYEPARVLVPCITWISDIAAILQAGMEPEFVDVHPHTLSMDWSKVQEEMAAFPTHCLGFNGLPQSWDHSSHPLVEDCCEATGAHINGRKLGTFSLMSNFSFYYAHHMSTIEGGMICTDDAAVYQRLRRLRSHGLVREMNDPAAREFYEKGFPDLDPQFIFVEPAYNVRSTELNAVLGLSQLKRLNDNIERRTANLKIFLAALDSDKYRNAYRVVGSSNYALPLVLIKPDAALMDRVIAQLRELNVEFRRGTAGGGNQLRQPYARARWGKNFHKRFTEAEHIHQYGLYIGNFPDLDQQKIADLCRELNAL